MKEGFYPLPHRIPRDKPLKPHYDRFIPNRAAMDFDIGQYLMVDSKKEKPAATGSLSQEAYRKLLTQVCLKNRTRILAFRSKRPEPFLPENGIPQWSECIRPHRHIPQAPEKVREAPDLLNDYYLNLLDWSLKNVLAIALENSVYLWNATEGTASELMSSEEGDGPITSINWDPEGRLLAVGLNSSEVQLWDASASKQLRTLKGGHQSRVGSLAWNSDILTTGGKDGLIFNNDVRVVDHIVEEYKGHQQEVCGLKWSSIGHQLASGGNDDTLYIWDRSMAAKQHARTSQWLHKLKDHKAAVKALAWCPFQADLLASGGGNNDRCIKFWNTRTGSCLKSVDTGSQVCALLWSKIERELLSSHGGPENQLTLWKYPSMNKMTELRSHTDRVIFMAQSPDGCTVASAAGDEKLMFWNVFGDPEKIRKSNSKQDASVHILFHQTFQSPDGCTVASAAAMKNDAVDCFWGSRKNSKFIVKQLVVPFASANCISKTHLLLEIKEVQ